jgi:ubiquinone/menaquinone biosynthesis C-methylase UbiE
MGTTLMEQKKKVVDHFDEFAEDDRWSKLYDEQKDPIVAYNFLRRQDRVEELCGDIAQPGATALDIGCGTGILAPFFVAKGCAYHGSDIAEQMIQQARERVPSDRATFSVGDVEGGLAFPDGRFDIVTGLGLLEYLDDLDAALDEIVRVTRPGGSIVVSVPQSRCLNHIATTLLSPIVTNVWAAVKRLRGMKSKRHDIYHRRFTPAELDRMFAERGCAKTGQAFYNLEVLFYPFQRLMPRLSYGVKSRVERYQDTWMRIFATGYILRCRKAVEEEV